MTGPRLGPVEVVALGFPGGAVDPAVHEELRALLDRGTLRVVDALWVHAGGDGGRTLLEVDQADLDGDAALPAGIVGGVVHSLLTDDDAEALTAGLAPGSAVLLLVFEHASARPLRAAVEASGGVVAAHLRIPGAVVDEVLDAVAAGTGQEA